MEKLVELLQINNNNFGLFAVCLVVGYTLGALFVLQHL